jgi:3-phosphoshikimate 1-carboxyvinyltransferase
VQSTRAAIEALGAAVTPQRDGVEVEGAGLGLGVDCERTIDCGNSGTTMRLLMGMVSARPCRITFDGDASLRRRPMERVAEPLRAMGAEIESSDGTPPVHVRGGALRPIEWTMQVASAQVKSAILLAGLRTPGTTTVHDPAASRDHTERMLAHMGARIERRGPVVSVTGGERLRPLDLVVPGDVSSAAFWMVAASIVPGSELVLADVGVNPTRLGVVDVLRRMGADVTLSSPREEAGEPRADVTVRAARLRGATITAADVPRTIDELPVLAVAAACAEGETILEGGEELRHKESDRLAALEQLGDLGVDIVITADGFRVRGNPAAPLTTGVARARGDHRMAMAFAVAALRSRAGLSVEGSEAVAISYPTFFDELARIGGGAEA